MKRKEILDFKSKVIYQKLLNHIESPQNEETYDQLRLKWNKKLKDSGFVDIENDYNDRLSHGPLKFSNVKGDFFQNRSEYQDFFRVIGLYAHNCKTIEPRHRWVLEEYAECGSIPKAIENSGSNMKSKTMWAYIKRNFPKMLSFVNQLDREGDS